MTDSTAHISRNGKMHGPPGPAPSWPPPWMDGIALATVSPTPTALEQIECSTSASSAIVGLISPTMADDAEMENVRTIYDRVAATVPPDSARHRVLVEFLNLAVQWHHDGDPKLFEVAPGIESLACRWRIWSA